MFISEVQNIAKCETCTDKLKSDKLKASIIMTIFTYIESRVLPTPHTDPGEYHIWKNVILVRFTRDRSTSRMLQARLWIIHPVPSEHRYRWRGHPRTIRAAYNLLRQHLLSSIQHPRFRILQGKLKPQHSNHAIYSVANLYLVSHCFNSDIYGANTFINYVISLKLYTNLQVNIFFVFRNVY